MCLIPDNFVILTANTNINMPTLRSQALCRLTSETSELLLAVQALHRHARPQTSRNSFASRFSFTLNNYTIESETAVAQLFEENPALITNLIYGRECGIVESTPHLQGFIGLKKKITWTTMLALLPLGMHQEVSHQTSLTNCEYCKKENDDVEWSELPKSNQGCLTDLEVAVNSADRLIADHKRAPLREEWAMEHPYIFLRTTKIIELAELRALTLVPICIVDPLTAELRLW